MARQPDSAVQHQPTNQRAIHVYNHLHSFTHTQLRQAAYSMSSHMRHQ